jgi:hypothetical protein
MYVFWTMTAADLNQDLRARFDAHRADARPVDGGDS